MTWPGDFVDRVICGDCLEVMKEIPDGAVDLVLTDPPYNVGKDYGAGPESDKLPDADYWSFYEAWSREVYRVLKENTILYVSSTSKQIYTIRPILEDLGFRWFQNLIWYGPNMVGGTSSFRMPWTQMYEPMGVFIKGKRPKMLNVGYQANTHDVFILSRPQRNQKKGRFHPTQKPLTLYGQILARTPGDIILDPFLGSGTTVVAAKRLGRHWIGIEKNPDYCKIAEDRLRQRELF